MKIFFDGSCRGNPGGKSSFGWVILDREDKEIASGFGLVLENSPLATNNYAEYSGLIRALEYIKSLGWHGELLIYGDSELVVKQVKGEYKCHKEHLKKLKCNVLDLLNIIEAKYRIEWIPREQNTKAHRLAAKGMITDTEVPIKLTPQPSRRVKKNRRKICLRCKRNQAKRVIPYCTPCSTKVLAEIKAV